MSIALDMKVTRMEEQIREMTSLCAQLARNCEKACEELSEMARRIERLEGKPQSKARGVNG
jgi:uncharacterized protein Yka (UPF0111/DUF47 family)